MSTKHWPGQSETCPSAATPSSHIKFKEILFALLVHPGLVQKELAGGQGKLDLQHAQTVTVCVYMAELQ